MEKKVFVLLAIVLLCGSVYGQAINVNVDIEPKFCPNPLNIASNGFLTVAVLGTEERDVYEIDPDTVTLNDVSAMGGICKDVSNPAGVPGDCNCNTDGPDGFIDLVVKFRTQDILETLGTVYDGDEFELYLDGFLADGTTAIAGGDCVVITAPGNEEEISVPDIVGLAQATAEALIVDGGLTVGIITETYSDTIAAGNVVSQTPAGGELLPAGGEVELVISLGPITDSMLMCIPAGTFEMGDHLDGSSDALPIHSVTIDSFYMSKYEITNQQYCDFLNSVYPAEIKVDEGVVYAVDHAGNGFPYCSTSCAAPNWPDYGEYSQINYSDGVFSANIKDGTIDMSNHPVVIVSRYGAAAYCNWRSQQEGLESCYNLSTWQCDFTKDGFRLPTEAEWEYAGRGGEHSPYYRYPWGDSINGSMANYWESGDPYETGSWPHTTPVGYYDGNQIPAGSDMVNGYGLYDMAGNVQEWCHDWYDPNYYSESPYENPTGPTSPSSGMGRVVRGGCWGFHDPRLCGVANRNALSIRVKRISSIGFRVCVLAAHPSGDGE